MVLNSLTTSVLDIAQQHFCRAEALQQARPNLLMQQLILISVAHQPPKRQVTTQGGHEASALQLIPGSGFQGSDQYCKYTAWHCSVCVHHINDHFGASGILVPCVVLCILPLQDRQESTKGASATAGGGAMMWDTWQIQCKITLVQRKPKESSLTRPLLYPHPDPCSQLAHLVTRYACLSSATACYMQCCSVTC